MIKAYFLFPVIILFKFIFSPAVFSQSDIISADTLRKGALNFFLDCQSCDMNYTRQEIPFVNYVRDTREAGVYLLVTSQHTGSGGHRFTFFFQGQKEFKGMNDTLSFISNPDETSTITREKKVKIMKMGLMRYVAHTPVSDEINISNGSVVHQEEVSDKWHNWVFELQTNPHFSSEESYKNLSFFNSINIRKISPDFKLEIALNQYNNNQKFIEDSVETVYILSAKYVDNLFVKSLNNHWSAGLKWDFGASTSENYDFSTEFLPSVEYDIYPYSEATSRQFRVLYSAGYQYGNYIDTTIYGKTEEGLLKQEIRTAYQVQKKWGSINVSLSWSNYLNDFSKNKLEFWGYMQLRILKGLSLSLNGGFAYINDQLSLAKGDLSDAERLLRLKEQATNFSMWGGVSFKYTFGSIYNNVVNPRFGNGGGNYYF